MFGIISIVSLYTVSKISNDMILLNMILVLIKKTWKQEIKVNCYLYVNKKLYGINLLQQISIHPHYVISCF